ncbi:MAG: shikimate dehydrogenase [Pirellulales bacterium]
MEYVDLEDDIATGIPRFGKTKRIVSYHDFRRTPDDLEGLWRRLSECNPDIVKIATMAHNPHDGVRMLKLLAKKREIPTVGMCMGDMGTPSRILSQRFSPPFVYATFHHERLLAPGQLSHQQMNEIYHHADINEQTKVFGVIGDPIGHSLSPIIHNKALKEAGLNAVYVPFRVPAEYLDQFLADAAELKLEGLSVTIPHKETVLKKITKLDPAINGIGAANTLIFKNGETLGYNTDYLAAVEALEHAMQPPEYDRGGLSGKNVLILGAGGGAGDRARRQIARRHFWVAGRTFERAKSIAEKCGGKALEWEQRYTVTPDVIVNCTPLGMHPNVDATPYERHHFRPYMVVFDTVYNPENTLLLKEARAQGCIGVSGVEMFLRQACMQFKLFTGQETSAEAMHKTLKRAIGPAKM